MASDSHNPPDARAREASSDDFKPLSPREQALVAGWTAEVERLRSELAEAHTWLRAAEMCDCECFPGAGWNLCRFAEALEAGER